MYTPSAYFSTYFCIHTFTSAWKVCKCLCEHKCLILLIYIRDMACSYVWCVSFARVRVESVNVYVSINVCNMARSCVWHVTFICVTCHIHMCDMSHSYMWHVTFRRLWRYANVYVSTNVWYNSSTCATWLIHMCGMSHSYVWHASSICVTWLVHMTWPMHLSDTTHPYMWHDSCIRVTWLIHICRVQHAASMCVTSLRDRHKQRQDWVMCSHDSSICVTWLIHMHTCLIHEFTGKASFEMGG